MCKVADAAKLMINHSIDLAEKDERYLIDFYKLHKLLYYAQGYMYTTYKKWLFEEDIHIHHCGPFIPEVLNLNIGYDPIREKFDDNDICPITIDRVNAIDHILNKFGRMTKDALVGISKLSAPYIQNAEKDVIPRQDFDNETVFGSFKDMV